MSLVREQVVFLRHVSELIHKASELGFLASSTVHRNSKPCTCSTVAARP
jgi:hypothetical protein